jgi:hypothetical protein
MQYIKPDVATICTGMKLYGRLGGSSRKTFCIATFKIMINNHRAELKGNGYGNQT